MTPATTTTSNAVPSNKQKPERKMEAFLPCAVSSACCARLLQGQWNVDKMHQSLTFLRGNTFFCSWQPLFLHYIEHS